MRNKVIFLDFDGVMVTDLSLWRRDVTPPRHIPTPINVAALNKVVAATGAKIVISSSWRHHFSPEDMQQILTDAGCKVEVIGETPILSRDHSSGLFIAPTRLTEIEEWLRLHVGEWSRFVVIDDDKDAGKPDAAWFFQTEFSQGLTSEMADDIIAHLNA